MEEFCVVTEAINRHTVLLWSKERYTCNFCGTNHPEGVCGRVWCVHMGGANFVRDRNNRVLFLAFFLFFPVFFCDFFHDCDVFR